MNAIVRPDVPEPTTAGAASAGTRFLRSRLLGRMAGLRHGRLTLSDAWGTAEFGTPRSAQPDLIVHVEVLDMAFYRAVAANGSVGAGESWMDGHWRCDNLVGLIQLLVRNRDWLDGMEGGAARLGGIAMRAWNALRRNTRDGSRRNIAAHYDLGNDFFRLFLSSDLLYSSAIWQGADDTLEAASTRKLEVICRKLELKPSDHVIEIGTGWGGFALHAAKHHGCRVTTTTISREQHALAVERIAAAGLSGCVTVLLEDYRDLRGRYDKLVSIEMVEAIGAAYLDAYFERMGALLKGGGLALLQAITIEDHRYEQALKTVDFIKRHVFPGSFIPSINALLAAKTRSSDLTLLHLEDFGASYARTLEAWRERFMERLPQARAQGFEERFLRLWEFYLAYCEGGFRERSIGVAHLLMSKPEGSAQPTPPTPPPSGLLGLAERGRLPDVLLRKGIRGLCARRLRDERRGGLAAQAQRFAQRIEMLKQSPVAIHTDTANRQHYELSPAFFELCLGKRLKYSACYYPRGDESLDQAEEAMLGLYAERAELADGQSVLELGCGWGSLTLWMAERFPRTAIVAVSNSNQQREYIEGQCRRRGLANVQVITCDVNQLDLPAGRFDRCVSIEMFEHMRNYETLLARIGGWLKPGGKLFVHVFAHQSLMYAFETEGDDNWMGRHFFSGGLMPAADTLLWFQRELRLEERWYLDGTHYRRTADHWLANQDARRAQVMPVLVEAYGAEAANLWFQRWRMFWMSCAELFGYAGGQEWLVVHYRFAKA